MEDKALDYIRIAKGGYSNYELIPSNIDVYNLINPDEHNYISLYRYNQEQYEKWKETGTVSGINDPVTDQLYFDFDSEKNLEQARQDTITVLERLEEYGMREDNVEVSFSGKKGFGVTVKIDSVLNPTEFENTVKYVAGDLKTFDPKIVNASRLIRLNKTKHQDTEYYKIPISISTLVNNTIDDIKELAKDPNNSVNKDLSPVNFKTVIDVAQKKQTPEVKPTESVDFTLKPRWLDKAKYILHLGLFPRGEGISNDAYMTLAATYKNQGFTQEQTLALLQEVAKKQQANFTGDLFPTYELKTKVDKVYSPTWNNGQYTYENNVALQWVAETYKLKDEYIIPDILDMNELSNTFRRFATDIEANTIKLGIPSIDNKVRLTTSMLTCLLAAPSSGKCLGKGTPIRMYDGSIKNVEDIKIGDVLMGDDSTPRNVLSTCRGKENLYEVQQENGDNYIINESHILSLQNNVNFSCPIKAKRYSEKIIDIPLTEYLQESATFKKYYRGYKVGVEYNNENIYNFDSYLLGLWLGDGTSAKPEITNSDQEIIDYLIEELCYNRNLELKNYDLDITHTFTRPNGRSGCGNNYFLDKLREFNLLNNKHIPQEFKVLNKNERLKLLAGIIDTDGYYDSKKNTYEITFKNEVLANDTTELARSLGFRATVNKKLAKYKSFTKGKLYEGEVLVHRIYLSGDDLTLIPCKVERKKAKENKSNRSRMLTRIHIKPLGVGDYYGFEIDGNHRFLLGDYTVTHNTSVSLEILKNTSKRDITSFFFSLDMGQPLVYQRLLQKQLGLQSDILFHEYKEGSSVTQTYDEKVIEAYKNVKFCFKSGLSVTDMKEIIIEANTKMNDRIRLVVIDYLECIMGPYSDATANTGMIAQQLKDMANELDVAIILLVQPQKYVGDPSAEILSYRNIKGASAIEQAASIIFTLWRPGFSAKNPQRDQFASMAVVKNRMGSLGQFDFYWNGLTGELGELDYDGKERLKALREELAEEKAKQESGPSKFGRNLY